MKLPKNVCFRFVREDMTSEKDKVTKWEIGKWNKQIGELKVCSNGLHASLTPLQSLNNIYGDRWFIAEYKGKISKEENKFCSSQMRLIKEIPNIVIKRFAIFCAKDCLKNYEKKYPNDKRPAEAIKAAEDYLDGKITLDELKAAGLAAESAQAVGSAWSAGSAARSAAQAVGSVGSAGSAAESATWSARSAARSAAWSSWSSWSARSAAEKRQNKELMRLIKEYCK